MAWHYGGRRERQLVFLVAIAPVTVVAAFVVANAYLLIARMTSGALFIVNVVIIIPAASWSFFQPAITTPMYSNAYYREGIRQSWLSPLQCKWAAEVVRFRESRGVDGQLQGNVERGRMYGVGYHAGVIGAVLFGIAIYPLLGGWTWAAFAIWYVPVVVILWGLFWRRMKAEADVAAREGFRMREIAREMRIELQREKTASPRRL